MTDQELFDKLKAEINAQLDLCHDQGSGTFTPQICAFISTPAGREKMVQYIINLVADEGMTIAQAINETEQDFNPNRMES